jgi:DNA polymerase III subunit chi
VPGEATMTRVDFHILAAGGADAARHYACQLAEKAYLKGHRVYIHATDRAEAELLDILLWSFRPDSFVPHALLSEADEAIPVAVGYGDSPGHHDDVMINLSATIPDFFSRFQRLGEVLYQDPDRLEAGRRRFRLYRERGHPLSSHNIQR